MLSGPCVVRVGKPLTKTSDFYEAQVKSKTLGLRPKPTYLKAKPWDSVPNPANF